MGSQNRQVTDSLIDAGIVTETQLTSITKTVRMDDSGDALIEELVARGSLTPYQATRIREGDDLVLGNYLLLSEIGAGGMGVVFKALHRRMDRVVAIKLIKEEIGLSKKFVARFDREVRAAARLNHPNAIAAYDADESELGPFLVMEYVEGSDLSKVVKHKGPLEGHDALDAIRQAALGIDYAHSQGVVHRDIKPANLMRDARGVIKIADLGIAHLVRAGVESTEAAPASGKPRVAGSVAFMSPEQSYDADAVDHRTDIYSLGATLFYLLTGKPMFDRPTMKQALISLRHDPAPSLSDVRDDVPPAVEALFQKMVAKDRDDRYGSMKDVIEELDRLLHKGPDSKAVDWNPVDSTVAIAESSTTMTRIVREVLSDCGCDDVHPFKTGAALQQSLNQLPADVIVASMELADMTGLDLAEHVRQDHPWSRTAIVVMTAMITDAHQIRVRRLSGVSLLEKPFDATKLSASINAARRSSLIADTPMANLHDLSVLIVDDSSVARRHIERVLTEIGFCEFAHADDGLPAMEQLKQRQFDLIIVDYNMPQMNGLELVSHIRSSGQHQAIPVIMCTTEYDPEKLSRVYALGVTAVCNKSFDPELVRNIVVRLFK